MRVLGGDAGDTGAFRDALVDQSLGERSSSRAGARLREAIDRDQACALEQVGHELRDRVGLDAGARMRLRRHRRGRLLFGPDTPQELLEIFGRFHLLDLSAAGRNPLKGDWAQEGLTKYQ